VVIKYHQHQILFLSNKRMDNIDPNITLSWTTHQLCLLLKDWRSTSFTDLFFSFRFNLAVINDSDVGLKTDLITINPSQIRLVHTHTHTHTPLSEII